MGPGGLDVVNYRANFLPPLMGRRTEEDIDRNWTGPLSRQEGFRAKAQNPICQEERRSRFAENT